MRTFCEVPGSCRLRLSSFGISNESGPILCSFESWLLNEGVDHETDKLPWEGDEESLFICPVTAAAATAADEMSPVKALMRRAPSAPCTESITPCSFFSERLTLLIFREGHLEMPCCRQILFRVVGHTA